MRPSNYRTRRRTAAAASLIWAILAAAQTGHTGAASKPESGFVPGTERHAPVPDPQKNAELASASRERVIVEMDNDFSTRVVTHAVYARIAADEEWRGYYNARWPGAAVDQMEVADNAMFTQFGIDFRHWDSVAWDSSDAAKGTCPFHGELVTEIGRGSADVVAGYFRNQIDGNSMGCAGFRTTLVRWHGQSETTAHYNMWTTSQHEFSHLFNAPDRYNQAASHQNDVMEDHYNSPSFWCKQVGYNDWGIVNSHAGSYD